MSDAGTRTLPIAATSRPFSSSTFTPSSVTPLNQPIDQSVTASLPLRLSLTFPMTIERTAPVLAIVGSSTTSRTSSSKITPITHGQRRRFFGLAGGVTEAAAAGVEFGSVGSVGGVAWLMAHPYDEAG